MHRLIAPALAALAVAAAGPAFAKADVSVAVGADLQKKADTYGQRELTDLTKWLDETVTAALAKDTSIARVDLVIEDVKPNRPTPQQTSRRLGLSSFHSVAVGGARVSGTVERADGTRQPIDYAWYETDIRNTRGATTWSDANRSFQFLAGKLAKGEAPASTRHARGGGNGDFGDFRR